MCINFDSHAFYCTHTPKNIFSRECERNLTLGAFLLPFKLRELKMRLLLTRQFRKNSHIYRKKDFTLAWGGFSGNSKKGISAINYAQVTWRM